MCGKYPGPPCSEEIEEAWICEVIFPPPGGSPLCPGSHAHCLLRLTLLHLSSPLLFVPHHPTSLCTFHPNPSALLTTSTPSFHTTSASSASLQHGFLGDFFPKHPQSPRSSLAGFSCCLLCEQSVLSHGTCIKTPTGCTVIST